MVTESAEAVDSLKGGGRLGRPAAPPEAVARPRRPRLGPYSGVGAIAALDGRSCEYRYYKKCRDELLACVGAPPTAIQRELIEQAAWLKVRIGMMNRRLVEESPVATFVTDGSHLAWISSLSRILILLDFTCGTGGELAAAAARRAAAEALHCASHSTAENSGGLAADGR
jgi:hypothetical protein